MIERQLDGARQGRSDVWMPTGRGGEASAQPPETRVLTLERELAEARAMYTDKHPEVQRLQEELATARKEAVANRDKPTADRLAQVQSDPGFRALTAGVVCICISGPVASVALGIVGSAIFLVGSGAIGLMVLRETDADWEHTPEYRGFRPAAGMR